MLSKPKATKRLPKNDSKKLRMSYQPRWFTMFWQRILQFYSLFWTNREKFSQAINIEPSNHVLYSNRSGAYASLKDFTHALEDANKVTEIKPDWAKGWTRKGAALHGQGNLGGRFFFL